MGKLMTSADNKAVEEVLMPTNDQEASRVQKRGHEVSSKPAEQQEKWLKIRGRTIDVTNFKHPGGNVVDYFYGIDATSAFEAFHGHTKKANVILKALPDLSYEPKDAIKQPEEHVTSMTRTYADWQKRGLFKPRPIASGLYGGSVLLAIALSWVLAPSSPVLAGLLVGLAWAHCGFLQHMGGHRELGSVSFAWQNLFEGLCKGGSGTWWRNRHNKHHAKTNVLGEDGDLRTAPFFAWDETLVKKVYKGSLRWQWLTFIPALGLYVFIFAFTVRQFVFRKKLWLEATLIALHYAIFALALYQSGCTFGAALTYYCIGYAFQGMYLGFFFSLSHFAVERLDTSATWLDGAMRGTVDWGSSSAFAGYLSGFLNVQIEHHMAPQMPMENLRLIVADCRKLAKENGLPHRDMSFREALKLMIDGLYQTGQDELKRRNSLVCAAVAMMEISED